MSYMQELESKLKGILATFPAGDLSADDVIKSVKLITLDSYRNGVEAGKLHAHDVGVKAIQTTFHPGNERRSSPKAPFKSQHKRSS
jgi:hypothetical protein